MVFFFYNSPVRLRYPGSLCNLVAEFSASVHDYSDNCYNPTRGMYQSGSNQEMEIIQKVEQEKFNTKNN